MRKSFDGKKQTIGTEQFISKLSFEAANKTQPFLFLKQCLLRLGSQGKVQDFKHFVTPLGISGWWRTSQRTGHLPLPPLGSLLPSLFLFWGVHGPVQKFMPPALKQLPICFVLQRSARSSPSMGDGNKHHVRDIVFSYSLSLGTVVAGPVGYIWSRFVSTAPAVSHKSVTPSPCPNITTV